MSIYFKRDEIKKRIDKAAADSNPAEAVIAIAMLL